MVQSLHDARFMAKPVDVANNNAMSIPSHLTGLLTDMIIGINSPLLPSQSNNSRQGRGENQSPPNYKLLNNIASSGRGVANNNDGHHQLHRQTVASPTTKKVKEVATQAHKNRQVRKTQKQSDTRSSGLHQSRLVNKVVEEKKEWVERNINDGDDLHFMVDNFWKNLTDPLPQWYVRIQRDYPLQNRV